MPTGVIVSGIRYTILKKRCRGNRQRGEDGQAEPEHVLERDPAEHEDEGDEHRAGATAGAQHGLRDVEGEADAQQAGDQPDEQAPGACARAVGPHEPPRRERSDRDDERPAEWIGILEQAQKVHPLRAEEQLLVVGEADEVEA